MRSLQDQKDALRTRMRAIRASIPSEERLRLGPLIEANLLRLPQVAGAGTILLFYSFGSEVPTAGTIQHLLDGGKRVLLPFLEGTGMEAAELRPGDSLAASTYGPKEPQNRVPIHPDEVGGHYDRYLSRLPVESARIGIAFHVQLVPAVPHDHHDQPLDAVVTEAETIRCRRTDSPP
jgi:5-formyltetrahydrofolate cyclo-ligase